MRQIQTFFILVAFCICSLGLASAPASNFNEGQNRKAFEIALSYFDPNLNLGIKRNGAEHLFILGLLESLFQKDARLKEMILGSGDQHPINTYNFDLLSTLSGNLNYSDEDIKNEEFSSIDYRILLKLKKDLQGCNTKTSREAQVGRYEYQVTTISLAGSLSCNSSLVKSLSQSGFDKVVIADDQQSSAKSSVVQLLRKPGSWISPYRMQKSLTENTATQYLSRIFEKIPDWKLSYEGLIANQNGYGFYLKTSAKDKSATTLDFTYKRGWGDCMAGCTGIHAWRGQITAKGPVDAPVFEINKFVEEGDPLPKSE